MQPHLLVPQQVPEFVRAEYPAFLEFLKAYYQWLEQEASLGKLETLLDVDTTVDGFLQYFRKQLDVYGITSRSEDKLYIRHIKELYAAKGSNASYEFLFKILFNKTSNTVTPWDYVFIPSNGKWTQDTTVLVAVPVGFDVNGLEGNAINVTADDGLSYRTFVRNANRRSDGVVELFITRVVYTGKLVSITTAGGVTLPILTTIIRAVVEKPGSGFRVGQVFQIDSYGGSGTLCKVKSVNSNGGIVAIDLIRFGVGYSTDFNLLISPQTVLDITSFSSSITLGSLRYTTDDIVNMQVEEGSIVKHTYTDLNTGYLQDATYVGETAAEIRHQNGAIYEEVDYASIKFITGQLCVYPGYYIDSNNIIGDSTYIQDSFFYQVYSYVTEVDEALDSYSTILRNVLHPAGAKHFGVYQITNSFQLNVEVDPSLNILAKEDAVREFLFAVDQLIIFYTKNVTDNVTTSDTNVRSVQYNRTMSPDSVTTDDTNRSMSVTKGQFSHSVTLSDETETAVDYNRTLAPSFVVTNDFDIKFELAQGQLSTTISVSDNIVNATSYIRTFAPLEVTIDDTTSLLFSLGQVDDGVAFTDIIQLVPGIEAASSVSTLSQITSINTDKYISNNVQTANALSGLYMAPYYVQQEPPYWQAGYLENEREFTN